MAYTTTTTTGYGSRLGSSFKSIGTGLILFAAATALLWWNEGRAKHTADTNAEVLAKAVDMPDITSVDAQYNGQLVHATGTAQTTDILTDGMFGISVNAMQLTRTVEYYQWVEKRHTETKEKIGGTKEEKTTYTYERQWTSEPVESSSFTDPDYKQVNSVLTRIDNSRQYAQNVAFGAYQLPDFFIQKIGGSQILAINLSDSVISELNAELSKVISNGTQADITTKAADATAETQYIHANGNQIYIGKNAANPAVGDVRLTYNYVPASAEVSLIAQVAGATFAPWVSGNGQHVSWLTAGNSTIQMMVESAQSSNTMMTWLLRVIGIILVCAALKMIFSILVTLLKVLPFLASILNFGVSLVCNVIGIVWSLLVIALAWIFYRPIVGIILLVVIGVILYFFITKGKSRKAGNDSAAVQAGIQTPEP